MLERLRERDVRTSTPFFCSWALSVSQQVRPRSEAQFYTLNPKTPNLKPRNLNPFLGGWNSLRDAEFYGAVFRPYFRPTYSGFRAQRFSKGFRSFAVQVEDRQ